MITILSLWGGVYLWDGGWGGAGWEEEGRADGVV